MRSVLGWALPAIGFISLLALWHAAIVFFDVKIFIAPDPLAVGKAIYEYADLLWSNALPTALEAILGFLAGNAIGVLLAAWFVNSKIARKMYFPVVVIFNTIPIIALSPILILIFGLGISSKVAVAAIICMFPTLVNTLRGLESITHSEMELMKIMSASPREIFFKLRVPKSLPFLFTALKIAATTSVIGAIIAEWVGAESGLGVIIIQATFDYRTTLLYAAIAASSVLALAMFGSVVLLERLVLKGRDN